MKKLFYSQVAITILMLILIILMRPYIPLISYFMMILCNAINAIIAGSFITFEDIRNKNLKRSIAFSFIVFLLTQIRVITLAFTVEKSIVSILLFAITFLTNAIIYSTIFIIKRIRSK